MRPTIPLRLAIPLVITLVAACSNAADSTDSDSVPIHGIAIVLNASTKGAAAFSPNPFAVSLGADGTVIWANLDFTNSGYGGTAGTTHHLVEDAGAFDSGLMNPKEAFTFTFVTVGTYTYHCSIHPTMTGTITVGN